MTTITNADLRSAFDALVETVRAAGLTRDVSNMGESATLDASNLRLRMGSPMYGNLWRLNLIGPFSAHYTMLEGVPEYLGATKREAWETLWTATRAMRAILALSATRLTGEVSERETPEEIAQQVLNIHRDLLATHGLHSVDLVIRDMLVDAVRLARA